MGKMTATHPIPRLLALLVADVFFQRSSLFRTLMIGELNEFFELTLGISDANRPLPPPAKSAAYGAAPHSMLPVSSLTWPKPLCLNRAVVCHF